jgi:alkylated DNA repair dioxygenase AlkB
MTKVAKQKKKAPLDIWPSSYKGSTAAASTEPTFRPVANELAPGMIIIKGFLDPGQQQALVDEYRGVGIGDGGFYQPTFSDGNSRMHLFMMCLGVHWNLEKSAHHETAYEGKRSDFDDAEPPSMPEFGLQMACAALEACRATASDPRDVPECVPDICISNFYTHVGKLGMHQDRDEQQGTLKAGLPVISLSLGDSCDFCYGDRDKPSIVSLQSGDALIFGNTPTL